jgi:type II secretory pathway pseudopilin PulG
MRATTKRSARGMIPRTKDARRGWTFVEMLVSVSISAVFLGAASLVLSSISTNSKRLSSVVSVNIGATSKQALYGQPGSTISTYSAPCYGRVALAQDFRDLLREDAETASIVHCLPRILPNATRPEFLRYVAGDPGSTAPRPRLDTPEGFRQFLASVEPTSAGVYSAPIRNVPGPNQPNTTVFFLAPAEDPGFLRVRAVYEIDYLSTANPAGTYASVRRFRNGTLTHYYDVFYETGPGSLPLPGFAAFERKGRLALAEGVAIDRFKVAAGTPFYFVWLPDPSLNPHRVPDPAPPADQTSARSAYQHLGAKTSLSLVLPMFPGL